MDIIELPLFLYSFLKNNTDENHIANIKDIQASLEEDGEYFDRRSIYKAIRVLNEYGFPVLFKQIKRKKGYYLEKQFRDSEIFLLKQTIAEAFSLSLKETRSMDKKLDSLTSLHLPKTISNSSLKTDNTYVLEYIDILLIAIQKQKAVSFRYYDITVSKEKKYRKNKQKYYLFPYAITSWQGRYYAILYSPTYKTFTNYRIDKMELVELDEDSQNEDSPIFDLDTYMSHNFNMYSGKMQSVRLNCDLKIANILFDQFGKDILINKVNEEFFSVSLRTAISPTLISWLLQFYKEITILSPKELIEEVRAIAKHIEETY